MHEDRTGQGERPAASQSDSQSAPERHWTDRHGGRILTSNERLAGEMRDLGDGVVEYVRADMNEVLVDLLKRAYRVIGSDDLARDIENAVPDV